MPDQRPVPICLRILISLLLIPVGAEIAHAAQPPAELTLERSRYSIEVPDVVLTDVPVERVTITALNPEGRVDTSFEGRPLIRGLRFVEKQPGERHTRERALPAFEAGRLVLETDLAAGRKVYIVASEIAVDPENPGGASLKVYRTQRWFSIVPPLLAIVLALWLRSVLVALFAAIYSGAVILAQGNFFLGFVRTLDTYIIGELAQSEQSGNSHIMIILFTVFLGAMVGVMAGSGGTQALVARFARYTQKREHGQMMTWALGLIVFFDDYANTLLVGSTMRPVTDRLKISREKLAFLVDSTAAPIAGLAIISTWVGVEIGYISDTYARLGMSSDVYATFLATLPYRFYPLHLLVFVWLIAYSGHDYGPMLKAEIRALSRGELSRPGVVVPGSDPEEFTSSAPRKLLLRTALVPLVALLGLIVVGLWTTGVNGIRWENLQREAAGLQPIATSLWAILDQSSPTRVLFLSSFVASAVAVATAVLSRTLTLQESLNAWQNGAKGMTMAVVILVLAWSVATLCDADHLNTAGFLVELTGSELPVNWMPTLAFLLSGAVAFATGSSWATMGLLMPLSISVTHYLLLDLNEADPNHPVMLAVIGSVLAGAIFGDHCSPISDTTILSSAASGSDHIDHVSTQMPYAITVAVVSLLFGYIPAGFGYSPQVLLPMGLIVLYLLVQFVGQSAESSMPNVAENSEHDDSTAQPTQPDTLPDKR